MATTIGHIFFGFFVAILWFGDVTGASLDICSHSTMRAHTNRETELRSPNFPYNYPDSRNCPLTISSAWSTLCVKINMAELDLEESTDCVYDTLAIYSGDSVDNKRIVKKMCGKNAGSQPITFNSSTITIQFKSDASVSGKGFRLKFRAVLCQEIPLCGQTLTGEQGVVTSPRYPSNYLDNTNCYTHIRVPFNCKAQLVFTNFDLESQASCTYDSLEVFDGYRTDSRRSLGKVCGSAIPRAMTASSGEFLLHFVSDGSITKSGFRARYTAVCPNPCDPNPCQNGGYCDVISYDTYRCNCRPGYVGQTCGTAQCFYDLVSGSGRIMSPGYPHYYPNSLLCDFRICAYDNDAVVIRFEDFHVEDSYSCASDRLEIYDGDSPSHPRIGIYCGLFSTLLINSTQECIFLRFTSNRHLGATGFRAQYYAVSQGKVADACTDRNGGCEQLCVSGDFGNYTCACRPGYRLEGDGISCTDVDECIPSLALEDCQHPATCVNTLGSYYCQCDRVGYRLGNDTKSCVDVDECLRPEVHACSQQCTNTEGSYYCSCHSGYVLSANAKECKDVDECASNKGGCDQRCRNTPGSFECRCLRGLKKDPTNPRKCLDEDECALVTEEQCPRCRPTRDNWYRCNCAAGFRQSENPVTDGLGCIDIDECETTPNICGSNATCSNTEGSYGCACKSGFLNTTGFCLDANECQTDNGGCEDVCFNVPGSHHCGCTTGYSLEHNGRNCTDINECSNGSSGCSQLCTNTEGSFECNCRSGYVLDSDGTTCTDVDECEMETANCSQICNNTNGSYFCSCRNGYRLQSDRHQCQDINECTVSNGGCQHHCHNFPGGHSCRCRTGYSTSDGGITCDDINECLSSPCNMSCQNINGSYYCECPSPQFRLHSNGHDCLDVDECQTDNGGCQQLCLNSYGGYDCICYDGYEEHGRHSRRCRDIDECSTGVDSCDHNCFNTIGSYYCSCRTGFLMEADNMTCTDINECALNITGCSQLCENIPGGYRCSCFPGFEVNSDDFNICDDINECLDENGNCSGGCVNMVGSYRCTCEVDEKLSDDRKTCTACPTCEDFESLQTAFLEMRTLVRDLRSRVEDLEVASVQNSVPSEVEPNSVGAASRSGRRGS